MPLLPPFPSAKSHQPINPFAHHAHHVEECAKKKERKKEERKCFAVCLVGGIRHLAFFFFGGNLTRYLFVSDCTSRFATFALVANVHTQQKPPPCGVLLWFHVSHVQCWWWIVCAFLRDLVDTSANALRNTVLLPQKSRDMHCRASCLPEGTLNFAFTTCRTTSNPTQTIQKSAAAAAAAACSLNTTTTTTTTTTTNHLCLKSKVKENKSQQKHSWTSSNLCW